MKTFTKGQNVWVYEYDLGLVTAKFDRYDKSNTGHIIYYKGEIEFPKLLELSQIHMSERLAKDYSTAINFKRGWLRREFERDPTAKHYQEQKANSIESFPEMWI